MILGVKLLIALLFLWGVYRFIGNASFFKKSPFSTSSLKFAFSLKVLAGVILFLIYTFYYTDRQTADVFKYYDDGEILGNAAIKHAVDFIKIMVGVEDQFLKDQYLNKMHYWFRPYDHGLRNDNRIVIRINAVLHILSFGNYFLHALIFIFLSFLGLFSLAKLFYAISGSKIKAFAASFLIPSVFFWSSGVLKEALLIFALGIFCWAVYKLAIAFSWSTLCLFVVGFCLLASLKIYVLFALLPATLLWFLWMKFHHFWKAFFTFLIGGALVYFVALVIHPSFDFISLLVGKQHDFITLAKTFHAGSAIQMDYLENNSWSILKAIPLALFHVFTLPWFSQVKSPLYLFSIFENLIFFSLIPLSIFYFEKPNKSSIKFIVFSIIFILTLFTIIGLTTPVIGALVRYKMPALPFLFFGLLSFINFNLIPVKIKNHNFIKWINTHL
jgi:hypothetical protein